MKRYVIISHDGATVITYEGNYCEALDYAAQVLKIPAGKYVNDFADVFDEEEEDE